MKILVTGGAGFVGRNLVEKLSKDKHIVTIFDNFSNSKIENIEYLIGKNTKYIIGDIRNYDEIHEAIQDNEIIIHLAAVISVKDSINFPKKTYDVNVKGTKNILNACKNSSIKKIISSSSAAVYGEPLKKVALKETENQNPISPYGRSKLLMENEITRFCRENKFQYIIFRFFNIYGIGQSEEYAGVITKFLKNIKENKKIEIFGDGSQTRDFIFIDDVVDIILKSIKSDKSGIFNFGTGKPFSIIQLAKKIILFSRKSIEIKYYPSIKGDIKNSYADMTELKKIFKYTPKFRLDEFLKSMDY